MIAIDRYYICLAVDGNCVVNMYRYIGTGVVEKVKEQAENFNDYEIWEV